MLCGVVEWTGEMWCGDSGCCGMWRWWGVPRVFMGAGGGLFISSGSLDFKVGVDW